MPSPSQDEVVGYLSSLRNWGRWGEHDQLGTLNHITDGTRVAAARLVRDGHVISLSRNLSPEHSDENPHPLLRFMIDSGEGAPAAGGHIASDWFATRFHGRSVTHLDALSHHFWDRQTYNGYPAELVGAADGARTLAVTAARSGIVSRGVLLDVPGALGQQYLEATHHISPDDLERTEAHVGVRIGTGDVLIVRTGRDAANDESYGSIRPGLRADCLPWLREREIAVLVGDGPHDVMPHQYPSIRFPIHAVGITAIGLWLLDNALLEELARHCAAIRRFEFQFVAGALPLEGVTGSPVNPLAIF